MNFPTGAIMSKMSSLLFAAILLLMSTGHCSSIVDDEIIARQCCIASNKLLLLARLQTDSSCETLLRLASKDVEIAGKEIINQQHEEAKSFIINALLTLKYTEILDCRAEAEIEVLQNDISKINDDLDA